MLAKVDEDGPIGTIIYVKPALTGDEPTDLLRYAAEEPEFPHQSTVDQWFDEAQFESYRALGQHTVETLLSAYTNEEELRAKDATTERLFVNLAQRWYPGSMRVEASFTRHGDALNRIVRAIRTNENLRFMDAQLYPEWPKLLSHTKAKKPQLWLPRSPEQVRSGFYICQEMIQLMENVYLDLNLEEEWAHPDNRGWMNLFRHWAWSNMFSVTWAVSAATSGARFQSFCERHFDVSTTDVESDLLTLRDSDDWAVTEKLLKQAEDDRSLNFLELNLVRAIVDVNRSPEHKIYVLKLPVRDPMVGDKIRIEFTFGFAIVVGKKLAYFRIQDHLRNMGFGRRGLTALVEARDVEDLDLSEMPPSVRENEKVSEDELRRFRRLYDSVVLDCSHRAKTA